MFRKAKQLVITGGKIETILGANTSFEGHLKTDGNLRIDGAYDGVIEGVGNIVVGETARIAAEIRAHTIQVWGQVTGKIVAAERLEILHTGRVLADIEVKSLLIDDGGIFRGACIIHGARPEDEPPAEEAPSVPEG
ncbi:MAG: polymer-forming cytoskeletal protein [Chloroflexi bacterium]|nr:polymer-forming cytoskeletal protein [Chloroflexota bacterium]